MTNLEAIRPAVREAVVERLLARQSSGFHRAGEARSGAQVEAALEALARDLAAGEREALRPAARALILELSTHGLTYADLRLFVSTLRTELLAALAALPEDGAGELLHEVEAWLFELVLVATMSFVAQRDVLMQQHAAQHEVERLESQLEELELALAEKTRLLELIRQASTPIAPVVGGILVVPLVGVFDSFRAELVTEKLLNEITSARARSVILDVSGVAVIDSEAAQLLIRLARAARLLGSKVFLVGLSPKSAQTIVELGIDLEGLVTLARLSDGLARALRRQGLKIVRV